ncbi:MAG TPA: hypothetical protein VIM73_22905 [Polyangiaceae bacterium]
MNTASVNSVNADRRSDQERDADKERSPAIASPTARRDASWVWIGLLVAIAVICGGAIIAAVSSSEDRGVRGPGDQASPDAPREEKVPPSTGR